VGSEPDAAEWLVRPLRAAFEKALIERLPALEAGLYRMPVIDFCFPELPAQQNNLVPQLAWEIQQSLIKIFYLDTN